MLIKKAEAAHKLAKEVMASVRSDYWEPDDRLRGLGQALSFPGGLTEMVKEGAEAARSEGFFDSEFPKWVSEGGRIATKKLDKLGKVIADTMEELAGEGWADF